MGFHAKQFALETWKKQKMPIGSKLVLMTLADFAQDKKGYYCCPSIKTIAVQTGLTPPSVSAALNTLSDLGLIERVRGDAKTNNTYRVNVPEGYDGNQNHHTRGTPHYAVSDFEICEAARAILAQYGQSTEGDTNNDDVKTAFYGALRV